MNAPKKTSQDEPIDGLAMKIDLLNVPVEFSSGGGSADIADFAWNILTVVFRYPTGDLGIRA